MLFRSFLFHKYTKNLDQTYHKEFAPLKYQIAEKLKHSPLLKELGKPQKLIPLFGPEPAKSKSLHLLGDSAQTNKIEEPGRPPKSHESEEELELEFELEPRLVPKEPEGEVNDFYGTYSVDEVNFKTINVEDTHQFDIDNLFFDPNLFSIVNTISSSQKEKRVLLNQFPELRALINKDLGFALQKKK